MATYAPVDGSGLAGALAEIPVVRDRLGGEPSDWRIREVGDGNLNLVFIVEGPAAGVVVKQALPYVRLVGESWPLPLERSWFEYNALTEEARYAGRLTPEVFHFDRAQAMIVMEYLHPAYHHAQGAYPRDRISPLRPRHRGVSGLNSVLDFRARGNGLGAQGACGAVRAEHGAL